MEKLFLSVLNMSLTASYVILLIILIRLPLKKAPKVISYTLWVVVAFRLLCPYSFESIFSLLPTSSAPIPQDIVYQQNPQINSGIPVVDTFVNKILPSPTGVVSVNPLQIYLLLGTYIWIIGFAVMLIYSIKSILLLNKRLISAKHTERNIYEADHLKTPFVLGLFRPRIYIPTGLTIEEKSYIIMHEQMHIRRFDHMIKLFAYFILSIHWFNPLVWIAFVLMSADLELSCDEKVIKEMGHGIKKPYAESLISLAAGRHILNGSPLAFGEGNVKGRIKNILNYKKPAFWMLISTIIVLFVVGLGLISNPRSSSPSMKGVKAPTSDDVRSIDLKVYPSKEGMSNQYSKAEPSSDEGLTFQTSETDLIKLGTIAFDEYMSSLSSAQTPEDQRIASYQLNDISLLAGDSEEFCVSLNYDFSTDNDVFVNPGIGAKGKGTWPDNYMEIKLMKNDSDTYRIVSIGTGGGAQGLEPLINPINTDIIYTEEEIQKAIECVKKYFAEEATSRILNDLWFDKDKCEAFRKSYMTNGKGRENGISEENVIVLLCNFTIEDDDAFKGYYPEWKLFLIRDNANDDWQLDDQGV